MAKVYLVMDCTQYFYASCDIAKKIDCKKICEKDVWNVKLYFEKGNDLLRLFSSFGNMLKATRCNKELKKMSPIGILD